MNINIGVPWLLTIVFATLKLCGVIDWSWWLVTAPVWGELVVWLSIIGLVKFIDIIHKITKRK